MYWLTFATVRWCCFQQAQSSSGLVESKIIIFLMVKNLQKISFVELDNRFYMHIELLMNWKSDQCLPIPVYLYLLPFCLTGCRHYIQFLESSCRITLSDQPATCIWHVQAICRTTDYSTLSTLPIWSIYGEWLAFSTVRSIQYILDCTAFCFYGCTVCFYVTVFCIDLFLDLYLFIILWK